MHINHCRLTGFVRSLACPTCNQDYVLPNFVLIVFYNGSHYNFKVLIKDIDEFENLQSIGDEIGEDDDLKADVDILENAEEEEFYSEESSICTLSKHVAKKNKKKNTSNKWEIKKEEFSMITSSTENFISFEYTITQNIKARFIDSCRFLLSFIDFLVKNFEKEKHGYCFSAYAKRVSWWLVWIGFPERNIWSSEF